ncbi:helix-turn-helix domain-containing protein [Nocardioides panacis]|uniref:Helix-turn-helix domain-containing protein n=1 Tax=Nocardioides panacis TaxID=2849501 RepID=A0A975SWZ8_9ACTN|nr:helix-turn-helix domain-containing protein [Nocardioides panacis]QWZ07381.1 helix-turn-helix domain-containing protein [Nocardioides panacis]
MSEPAQAEAIVTDFYLPHRLEVSPRQGDLNMSLTAVRLDQLTIGRLAYGQEIGLVTDEATNFHVDLPLAGHAEMSAGASEPVIAQWGKAAVFSPGEPAGLHGSADCSLMCLMIPRGSLEATLEELLGRSIGRALRFDFAMHLRGPVGRSWVDTLQLVLRELDDGPGLLTNQRAGRHVQSLLLDGLLLGQPNSYSEELAGGTRPGSSAAIARAVDLVNDRADEPWSSTSLAREVHASVRALQEGFKRDVGRPPMRYLRDVRLRRVHGDLQGASSKSTTVEAVAIRWGFLHMGRFAAAYRAAFGETPSTTLAGEGTSRLVLGVA